MARTRTLTDEQRLENKRTNARKWARANRESKAVYDKKYKETNNLKGLYIVYCLPNNEIPYVGQTKNPKFRMHKHDSLGKNTSEWFILQVCKSKAEALEVEAMYHEQGYDGKAKMKYKKVA